MSNPPRHPLEPIVDGMNSFVGRAVSYLVAAGAGSCLGLSIAEKRIITPWGLFEVFFREGLYASSLASPPSALSVLALGVGFIVYVRFDLKLRFLLGVMLVAALQAYCAGQWVWVSMGGGGMS